MRRTLVSLILLLCSGVAFAQMSEDKIIQYVQEQQAKGVPQEQIVYELNKRGVTLQQLQRMREKYNKQQSTGVLGNTVQAQGTIPLSRSRTGATAGSATTDQTFNLYKSEVIPDKTARRWSRRGCKACMMSRCFFLLTPCICSSRCYCLPRKRFTGTTYSRTLI